MTAHHVTAVFRSPTTLSRRKSVKQYPVICMCFHTRWPLWNCQVSPSAFISGNAVKGRRLQSDPCNWIVWLPPPPIFKHEGRSNVRCSFQTNALHGMYFLEMWLCLADEEATFSVQVWKCRWLGLDSKLCVAGNGFRGSLHFGWFKASYTGASENDLQR